MILSFRGTEKTVKTYVDSNRHGISNAAALLVNHETMSAEAMLVHTFFQ